MTPPTSDDIFDLIDTSWPPARAIRAGRWVIRKGLGGSKRTMAASCETTLPPTETEIEDAEAGMRALGQPCLFQLRGPGQADLDAMLAARGYGVVDRCTIFSGATRDLAAPLSPTTAWEIWPPLAIQKDIWAAGGIGAGRLQIMELAGGPKTSIIARTHDHAAGAAFVSATGNLAMIHAVETLASYRRKGVGRALMIAAANWCVQNEVDWLTLIVTQQNTGGNALYTSMGLAPVGQYHYRIQE